MNLEVRMRPVAELVPAPYNPRKLLTSESPAYRKLRSSLTEFGLVEPLVWNEQTGHVVGGHLRLRVLQEMGIREVPVSVVHLEEAREKALNIVLNNHEAQGRYDPTKLVELLEELDELGTLEHTGFDADTIGTLRFEPVADLPDDAPAERVEVTIVTDAVTFESLAPKLEEVVAEFDLVTHIRRT
jgi:ParB-like chromosome segregation protein Spo0J